MDELRRAIMTTSCRDCDPISKVPEAGKIKEMNGVAVQLMHNGLKVVAGGYHGDWMAQIIRGLRGHHEPQEEMIFHELLRYVRHGTRIVELGCFWAYYTLWYLHDVPGSDAICVEPDPVSFAVGKHNAALNGLEGRIQFHEAWVSDRTDPITLKVESTREARTLPGLNMGALLDLGNQMPIELLHIDTQGAETPFLSSIEPAHASMLRFLVVSTHHRSISGEQDTHGRCLDLLRALGAHVLIEHDVQESFSGDGLIVASMIESDLAIAFPPISRNVAARSLFPVR